LRDFQVQREGEGWLQSRLQTNGLVLPCICKTRRLRHTPHHDTNTVPTHTTHYAPRTTHHAPCTTPTHTTPHTPHHDYHTPHTTHHTTPHHTTPHHTTPHHTTPHHTTPHHTTPHHYHTPLHFISLIFTMHSQVK
jgi:hypothetical protein